MGQRAVPLQHLADDAAFMARRLARRVRRRPAGHAIAASFALVTLLVTINAAFFQEQPHPAPLMAGLAGPDAASGTGTAHGLPEEAAPAAAGPPSVAAPSAAPGDPAQPASELVGSVQEKLVRAGLYAGPVDGVLGPETVGAIEAFERSRGLAVTGEPRMDVLVALATGAPPARPSVETIAKVQTALNARGFGPVTVDGLMGQETGGAIARFERSRGMPETGRITDRLMEALELSSGA